MIHPYHMISPSFFTENAGTTLSVNLSALVSNYRYLDQKVGNTRCGAVVKADAYGLGMIEVARALQKLNCRDFFVAYPDEGIALRSVLNQEYAIYVLNGLFPQRPDLFTNHQLTPVLNDVEQLKLWVQYCRESNHNHPAALQFDTGMSRFGLDIKDIMDFGLESLGPFLPTLLISHLACADTPDHPMNQQQLEKFNTIKRLFPSIPASLSASSGIFLGKPWHFDLVRPGAALYGINPDPAQNNPMLPVITLHSKALQLRTVPKGASIGYGATVITNRPLKLAIISIGYADGLFRTLSNRIYVSHTKYPEKPLPVLGRISMDCLCIDISSLSENPVTIGDEIEIIGPSHPIESLAQAANTIGYEILTALGNRFNRLYL